MVVLREEEVLVCEFCVVGVKKLPLVDYRGRLGLLSSSSSSSSIFSSSSFFFLRPDITVMVDGA